MNLIIAGSRDYNNPVEFHDIISSIHSCTDITEIVSGCARGADTMGEEWADSVGIPIKRFPADWDKYGKAAGMKRNIQMAEYADALVLFWDGSSRGSFNMLKEAAKRNLKLYTNI